MSGLDVKKTKLSGVLLIKPKVFHDSRGYFYESWKTDEYKAAGVTEDLIQDNCSYSQKNILRGLHIQRAQGQMMWVTQGHIFQVVVDVRSESLTYGQHITVEMRHDDPIQVYMPPGFAGGFCVLSDFACLNYKCSQYYTPKDEGGILWSDPDLGIAWPVSSPILSDRDRNFCPLKDLDSAKI